MERGKVGVPEYHKQFGPVVRIGWDASAAIRDQMTSAVTVSSHRGVLDETGKWVKNPSAARPHELQIRKDTSSNDILLVVPQSVASVLRAGMRCRFECDGGKFTAEILWRAVGRGGDVNAPAQEVTEIERLQLDHTGADQAEPEKRKAKENASDANNYVLQKVDADEDVNAANRNNKQNRRKSAIKTVTILVVVAIIASGAAAYYFNYVHSGQKYTKLDCSQSDYSGEALTFDFDVRPAWFINSSKPGEWSKIVEIFDKFACQGDAQRQEIRRYVSDLAKNTDVELAAALAERY